MKYCSFCGKTNLEVRALIAGEVSNICDECVDACVDTLTERGISLFPEVARTTNEAVLAEALKFVLNGESEHFTHSKPIYGQSRSGRMFFQQACIRAAIFGFDKPLSPEGVAKNLMTLAANGARYSPENLPNASKGWAISYVIIDGRRVAIAWAEWIKE